MKLCKHCNILREECFFYRQSNSNYLFSKCKLCQGVKKDPLEPVKEYKRRDKVSNNLPKTCIHCNIEREDHFFYKNTNGVRFSKCKVCLGVKKILPNEPEEIIHYNQPANEKEIKEIYRFVWLVRTRGYGIDVIDFWRIIHYYECLWPDWRTDKTEKISDEISRKWKSLEKWFLKKRELNENSNQ